MYSLAKLIKPITKIGLIAVLMMACLYPAVSNAAVVVVNPAPTYYGYHHYYGYRNYNGYNRYPYRNNYYYHHRYRYYNGYYH